MLKSDAISWRPALRSVFRACVVGQAITVFVQAVLAGFALSGNPSTLSAHMVNGGIALLISLLQVLSAVPLRKDLPRWVFAASLGLLVAEGVQMFSGRIHLFALHMPLGVALFGGLAPLVVWASETQCLFPVDRRAGAGDALGSPLFKASIGETQ
jgi:hypothetical protein